jgi:hypothetical protein
MSFFLQVLLPIETIVIPFKLSLFVDCEHLFHTLYHQYRHYLIIIIHEYLSKSTIREKHGCVVVVMVH